MDMESIVITPGEAADFEEYKRKKRIQELRSKLRGLEPTLLRKNASLSEIRTLCQQAKRLSSVCICVQPVYVKTCKTLLKNTPVGISCIVGGNSESTLKTKLYEGRTALREGATELEFSPCVSAVINGNYAYFKREIKRIVRIARGKAVKVCLDAYSIPRDKLLKAALLAADCGAKYLSIRAEEELITLLNAQIKGKKCEIKVSGVETKECFRNMLELGCNRIGSELAEEIVHAMENEVNGLHTPVINENKVAESL